MGGSLFNNGLQIVFTAGLLLSWMAACPAGQVKYSKEVGDAERKLLEDYLAMYPKLVEWCGSLTMSVECHGFLGPESNPRNHVSFTQEVYTNGNQFFRIDEVGRRRAKSAQGKEVEGTSICILRPQGFVQIGNTPTNTRPIVENVQGSQDEHVFRIMSAGTPWSILTVIGAPLKTFIVDPPPAFGDYLIERVETITEEGRTCLRVSAVSVSAKNDRVTYQFLIDKESGVLREYKILDDNSKQANCGKVEYEFSGVQGRDIPKLTRYTAWAEVGTTKYNEMIHEVKQLKLGPAPLELFDPSSLGLKVAFPKKQLPLLWFYLAVAGLACVSVYIFSARSRKSGSR